MDDGLLAHGWFGLALLIWIGLCVGSFLNVVIYRLPVMLHRQWRADAQAFLAELCTEGDSPRIEPPSPLPADVAPTRATEPFNLMVPRSRCPACGAPIRPWQNVPVLSWLALRGRCGRCRAPISVRYPVVEILTGIVTVAVIAAFGFSTLAFAALLFTWTLLALAFIDYDTQLLPDQLTLPLLWLGLLLNALGGFVLPAVAVVGAAAGYLVLWSVYWSFKLLTGKEGMGHGDFKLLGAIGGWLGWQVLPATLLIAAALGLVYALAASLAGRRSTGQPVPFGPFLAIAGWIALMHRDRVAAFLLPS